MSTELDSFEAFIRQQWEIGNVNCSPEELLLIWRSLHREPTNGETEETLFDRLSKKGLLGRVAGGPTDLSSNPKHLEGFGQL